MRLGTRMFLVSFLIVVTCFSYPIWWVIQSLRLRYQEGVEELLVDQANIFAAIAGREMETAQFSPRSWHAAFDHAYARPLSAQIYTVVKTHVDLWVFITDLSGTVTFDSKYPEREGRAFYFWRDVEATVHDKRNTRMMRLLHSDPQTSAVKPFFYVASPILLKGMPGGAAFVAKPMTNINRFLAHARPQIVNVGLLAAGVGLVLCFAASFWLTRPVKRLTRYAHDVREGKRVPFPKLDRSEIGQMGQAFHLMQEALEGKNYVEQYVQTLTHEVKSPLSAIRGAAELLEEPDMPAESRGKFLANIRDAATRIQQIVDRMLELAALENLKQLEKIEEVDMRALADSVIESKRPMLSQKRMDVRPQIEAGATIRGDAFLLHQALSNLLQNAIEFSPERGEIGMRAFRQAGQLQVVIEDAGPGIPDFAREKVFDKFFSLHRPDTGKKSTGLGLNFVQEVAHLHHGAIRLENRQEHGARAVFALPLAA